MGITVAALCACGGGGNGGLPQTLMNPQPSITNLSPATVTAGANGANVTISGSGFVSSSTAEWNQKSRATTYVSSTQLQIALTAADLAVGGTDQISVVNPAPGGGASTAVALEVDNPIPVISAVSPNTITTALVGSLLTFAGTGFVSNSAITWNGATHTSIYVSATKIQMLLSPADLFAGGVAQVSVVNPTPGGGTAVPIQLSIINASPQATKLTPGAGAMGGPQFTLSVSGSGFVPASVVQWNGSAVPTTFVDMNNLTAIIPSKDILLLGNIAVTVSNPNPGGGVSSPLTFPTFLGIPANDLLYSASTQLLYASVPSTAGPALGNSIVPIDPSTGAVGRPMFVGSEPGKMALASDGTTVWVALDGAGAVRKVDLISQTVGPQFPLQAANFIQPYSVTALVVMPGHSNTIAVAAPNTIYSAHSNVAIFDNGVARPYTDLSCCLGTGGLAFDPTGTKLYEAGVGGYGVATVDSTGIAAFTLFDTSVSSGALHVDKGRAYADTGSVLDADTGSQLGSFRSKAAILPDSITGKGFAVSAGALYYGQNNEFFDRYFYELDSYDLSSFEQLASLSLGAIDNQNPLALARWGPDGLAFTNGKEIYIQRGPLVQDLSGGLADLGVSSNSVASATTGTNLTYTLTTQNVGPLPASPVTIIDTLPDGVTLQSAIPSQGTCGGGPTLSCNLGALSAGNSASVQIILTPLTPGTLANTVSVSAPQGDPNPSNNTAVTSTVVTGSVYNSVPVIASISPAFVQSGSYSFSLTVNGSGFSSTSTVRFNSTALPTAYIGPTQLTATVDASEIPPLSWAWISVSNPLPGGGTSANLPLTAYQKISLDVNRFVFDPFTRKFYATTPSTATQVAGNSLVSIDPTTGLIGVPLPLGNEPNRIAESADGNYVYVGLDGNQSLTRVDLTSMTRGSVYPLLFTGYGQFAAAHLAVVPGSNSLVAVDPGYPNGGIGLFDVSDSAASLRPDLAENGAYGGGDMSFPNATTAYTSGNIEGFCVWTVTSTGFALNNNACNGLPVSGGSYELKNGLIYGSGGGVSDPTTRPPTALGQFQLPNFSGFEAPGTSVGVAADPQVGRVFYLGPAVDDSLQSLLLSFDSSRYVPLASIPFPDTAAADLLRWGRDGLAWHATTDWQLNSGSGVTPGNGHVFLMRGPFVQPQWYSANPAPMLSAISPAAVAAASGNLILSVTGSGFVPGAVLLWNGAERTTTYIDSAHLTVAIPASDVAATGTASLVVNNPGSSNSGALSFSVN